MNHARNSRALRVTATTRAVRAALAVSATMLALAGSGVAYAGNCSVSALNTVSCNGVFTDTIIDFIPTVDLTLVLGDNAPTSVTPGFDAEGLIAIWDNVTVVSYADITTEAADGIYALGYDTASVSNFGSITTDATLDSSANAVDVRAFYDATVVNGGDILVYSNYGDGDVTAVTAYSFAGIATIDNQEGGDIQASAYSGDAYGVYALSIYGDATVINSGSIAASSFGGNATAITAVSIFGDASVTSSGHTEAYSLDGNTTGIYAYSLYGIASIDNSGDIQTGSVYGNTVGAYASTVYDTASVTNSGSIEASSIFGGAAGASATSAYGIAEVINADTGTIQASSNYYAVGAYVSGGEVGRITNYGSIDADAHSEYGYAYAYGTIASGGLGVNLNYGSISAEATVDNGGLAIATGAFSYASAATIVNEGSIEATAQAGYGAAVAYGANAYGLFNGIYNYGDVQATASTTDGYAVAYGVNSNALSGSTVYNSGTGAIGASATLETGAALADGIQNFAYLYGAYVTNDGSVTATATAGDGYAFANGISNTAYFFGVATTTNNGDITATASIGNDDGYGVVEAIGIYNYAFLYDSSVVNNGSVSAVASAGGTYDSGTGNCIGDCNQVSAIGVAVINFVGYYSSASLENGVDGVITATASVDTGIVQAYGALVQSGVYDAYFYGGAYISNDGSISASASGQYAGLSATGAEAFAINGNAGIINHGDISATARVDGVGFASTTGVNATALGLGYYYGTNASTATEVLNFGDISATTSIDRGYAYATGVVTNYAKYSTVYNAADATISATASADTWGIVEATGLQTYGKYENEVVNHGTIEAFATSHGAVGVYSYVSLASAIGVSQRTGVLNYNNAVLSNYGDINATAISYDADSFFAGGAGATGVSQRAYDEATVNNFGNITAYARADFGGTGADGVVQGSGSDGYINNYAGATITAVAISATLDGDVFGYGGRAVTDGTRMFGNSVHQYNGGEIVASSFVAPGSEFPANGPAIAIAYGTFMSSSGRNSSDDVAELLNTGSIEAYAGADMGLASAYGAFLTSAYFAGTTNSGDILAVADADEGFAFAVGNYNFAQAISYTPGACNNPGPYYCYGYDPGTYTLEGGIAELNNESGGEIIAYASADAGVADAYGSVVLAAYGATTTNAGSIKAYASADAGLASATGSLTNSFYGLPELDNSGSIYAGASGDVASATGALVIGSYGVVVGNAAGGEITAAAFGPDATAIGVSMDSDGLNVLTNAGDITALGDGLRIAVASSAYSVAAIYNAGTMTGSIQTGIYDDYLYNDGTWNALQYSYFGAGDDTIINAVGGTISLSGDATIALGTFYYYGNQFINNGTIAVTGTGNVIDMGSGSDPDVDALVPSLNPHAFYNYGVIDFQDGDPDGVLTIIGDFAGDGDINVDVSAIGAGASDLLYIDGSVVDGSVSTINADMIDTPDSASTVIPIVYVSGNSAAGDFVLGDVSFNPNTFLAFDFGLISDVDASNATDDVYSLGIDVTGLSDAGALAASVVPGVQSLANAQVGTWRQRMGVINKFQDSTFSLWARWFQNEGEISPEHTAGNFGNGGNFSFDQKNSGFEAGADFSVSDEFSFGFLAAVTEANTHLNNPGVGSTNIDADTYGVYATWLSNGFYVDGSYRWMGFTAKSSSVAGTLEFDGDAEIFNIEAGYAWTLDSGLQIEPQAQYTNTSVSNVDAMTLGQTTFQAEDGSSEVGRLGVAIRQGFGDAETGTLWTPYATLSAVWEMDGENDYSINGNNFVGRTSTDGSSVLLEAGLTAQTGNLSVFGGINWQDGGAMNGWLGGQLGIRYTFGHAAPAPAPAPVAAPAKTCADLDDDGDGVNNCNDKCPGSAAGEAVGLDGCPVPAAEPEPVMEPKPFRN